MPSLAGFGRIALELRAGQIVEQDFEFGLEQGLSTLLQEAEQFRLVRQQLVEAATDCPSAPDRRPHPADRPSRFVHTIAGAAATRCRDRSIGK
jgi:hypothetical protein